MAFQTTILILSTKAESHLDLTMASSKGKTFRADERREKDFIVWMIGSESKRLVISEDVGKPKCAEQPEPKTKAIGPLKKS